jgi:hypothetical protein
LTVIAALGTGREEGSRTVPVRRPVAVWANAAAVRASKDRIKRSFIFIYKAPCR